MAKFEIIIPYYQVGDVDRLARACLKSIREHSTDYRLIWVDNGGSESLLDELMQHKELTIVRMGYNSGFVKAVNAGLMVSTAEYLVVMNNDTEAAPNWLRMLSEVLTGQNVVSGPRTTTPLSWQGKLVPSVNRAMVLSKNAMLAFFCTMFRRDVFETVGILDEDFGVGLGDDDEFCGRVHKAGYDLVWVPTLTIPHHHRSTFRQLYKQDEIAEMQRKAIAMFYEKAKEPLPSRCDPEPSRELIIAPSNLIGR